MKTYNKLVRDKIPEIIKENGEVANTRILDDDEYIQALNVKLKEEVNEYLESGSVEELADIVEVIYGILHSKGVSIDEFERIRLDKVEKRGAFKDKIFLESTLKQDVV